MRRWLIAVLIAAAHLLSPPQVTGQLRLLGTAGLGRPLKPVDARARALGDAAIALHGSNLSAINPAALARLNAAGIWVSYQPESRTVKGELANGDFETADFPLVRVALPVSNRWVLGAGFGGYFDQDWGVMFTDTLSLSTGDLEFEETRRSDGGISQFRIELGGRVGNALSLGMTGIYYSGESRLSVSRVFEVDSAFNSFFTRAAIQYQGWGAAFGAEYRPLDELAIGAVATWNPSGLTVRNDTTNTEADVDLPIGFDIGASLQLSQELVAAVALGWTNWSALDDDFPGRSAADAYRIGGGIELEALTGRSSSLFVRLGGRFERLPFVIQGGKPWERSLSLGLGAVLRGGRGRLDGTLELGGRGAEELLIEEDFTRYTFSVAIFTS